MTDDEKYRYFDEQVTKTLFEKSEEQLTDIEMEIALIGFSEIEINSGGFESFFEHSDPDRRQKIYQIYEKIGAKYSVAIFKRFQQILDTLPPDTTIGDLLGYNIKEFDELFDAFTEYQDNTFVLAYDYYFNKD